MLRTFDNEKGFELERGNVMSFIFLRLRNFTRIIKMLTNLNT